MASKPWYKSKIVWVGILTVAVSVGSYLGAFPGIIPPEFSPYVLAAVGALNIILRVMTSDAVTLRGSSDGKSS